MTLSGIIPGTSSETQEKQQPFRLFGSMRLTVPAEEFDAWLDENRKTQADSSARKLRDL
jgi:hypothetical protein